MSADYAAATVVWGANTTTLLDLLKLRLDICSTDTSQDELLALCLQIAGEACEAYCDNVLAKQAVTEQHPRKVSPIALRYYPFDELTLVTVDGEDVTESYETFESEGVDYLTSSREGCTRETSFKQMNIDYNAGYEPLPADLATAIASAAIGIEQGTGAKGEIKRESVVGVGSIEYATSGDDGGSHGGLSSTVTGTLDKYKREYC